MKASRFTNRSFISAGKEYLYFGGTAYLGLNQNLAFRKLIQAGFELYGTNYGSSPLSNMQLAIYEQAENYLSRLTGAETGITLSSGLLAGQILIQQLNQSSFMEYAPQTHPALKLNPQQVDIGNYDTWFEYVLTKYQAEVHQPVILLLNSIDPLFLEAYHFDWIRQLYPGNKYLIIIDDSHGIGVTGSEGEGVRTLLPDLPHLKYIVMASLGKALGIPGGVIFPDQTLNQKIRNHPFFGSSSPINPAYLYALVHAGSIYQDALVALRQNITYFREAVEPLNLFKFLDNYPVFYTTEEQLYPYLAQKHILISSFRYPTGADPLVNRVVVNSNHTKEDLDLLVGHIKTYKK
ncbi:MAG: aminotransferase class I/II-fold pyridoxal phosphate-dependent enzyme [Candidatus Cyclobacteriaceae bacterium M3_2C_046]